jgi:hypothetical protein
MKKLVLFLTCLSILVSLVACGPKYEPQASTEEELRTVWTLEIGEEVYTVNYELYRAIFLNLRNSIDGGDRSVWNGESKKIYIDRIDGMILDYVCDIYAAFSVCKSIGFDIYSDDVDDAIEDYITAGVEGGIAIAPTWEGIVTEVTVSGAGSYEEYLKSLTEMNLNYSVQDLLYRYYIALSAIDSYYIGTYSDDNIDGKITVGAYEYTRDEVYTFYNSEDCVRVLRHSFSADISYTPREKAEGDRSKLEDAALYGESEIANCIIGLGAITSASEIKNGTVVGRYNLDDAYAMDFINEAFATKPGQISEIIEINDGLEHTVNILYKAEKSDEHFNSCYSTIAYVFLKNKVGSILNSKEKTLKESATPASLLETLDRAAIKM